MKLKQSPEDFFVEEVTDFPSGDAGAFAFYRMEKKGWSTPDALAAVRRRWQVDPARLSYGGLKDRHAHTIQYFTIFRGPKRGLRHHDVTVSHLGQAGRAYTSADIKLNRFRVTLRDLAPSAREELLPRLADLAGQGLPNYFDDQRFGSVAGESGEFIGRLLVKGDFEGALRLALAGPYEFDRASEKEEKRLLLEHWGDWARLKDALPRGHARSLVDYLRVHPIDFKGAVVRLRPELKGLYLSAYQSHLWNRVLARWLELHCRPGQLRPVQLRLGPVPFPAGLEAEQQAAFRALQLPLPSARWKPAEDDPRLELTQSVLAEEGFTLRELQVKGVRDLFFSRGERAAHLAVGGWAQEFGDDERHREKLKLILSFELPRGSYATLLVKSLEM